VVPNGASKKEPRGIADNRRDRVALDARRRSSQIGNHMVTISAQLDRTFAALGDTTRRAILSRLALGETTVGELARPFRMSRPAISKHLRVLEEAGLVRRTRDGRVNRCTLEPEPMRAASEWVALYRPFWEGQLDALARYMEATTDE
jgi:DNA-binding transcriptional ArsR family regulator